MKKQKKTKQNEKTRVLKAFVPLVGKYKQITLAA